MSHRPLLGCREFAAAFSLVTPDSAIVPAIGETRELGWMLHDMDFTHPSSPQPKFFNAKLVAGVIEVPPFEEARG